MKFSEQKGEGNLYNMYRFLALPISGAVRV